MLFIIFKKIGLKVFFFKKVAGILDISQDLEWSLVSLSGFRFDTLSFTSHVWLASIHDYQFDDSSLGCESSIVHGSLANTGITWVGIYSVNMDFALLAIRWAHKLIDGSCLTVESGLFESFLTTNIDNFGGSFKCERWGTCTHFIGLNFILVEFMVFVLSVSDSNGCRSSFG